jgi:Zn-dependent M28 family amino/carboxypeptidase
MKKFCVFVALCSIILLSACKSKQASSSPSVSLVPVGPVFVADSAFAYCQAQCEFGPRSMNSDAHEKCAQWIVSKFEQFGCKVTTQDAMLTGYDGTALKSKNIIASYRPSSMGVSSQEGTEGGLILLCAHWDSRPWADNDPDSTNWHKPVMAANDGASGVAVMLEIARLLQKADSLQVGVDFICFDAEDWGTPQWDTTTQVNGNPWALGAQYWAQQYAEQDSAATYRYGILLDMVGGQGSRFYQEGFSRQYAQNIVNKVWTAAKVVGYGSMFPDEANGGITDDHVPVNEVAKIPCIDIIPYYPDCHQSSFGPTWHTAIDDMDHIDKNTLQAVGQTVIQVLFSEK